MFKGKNGLTGIDIVFAVIIIILFTSIILSLMYNIKLQNTKQVYELACNIFATQTLENIGISDYEDIIESDSDNNSNNLIPDLPSMFHEKIEVESINDIDSSKDDIIKKVTVTITYNISGKTYQNVYCRLKEKD